MTDYQSSPQPSSHVAGSLGFLRSRSASLSGVGSGALKLAFSLFVWGAFYTTPRPNPWAMGEAAFVRILGIYGVAIVGSAVVCVLTLRAAWKKRLNWVMWLSLPCALYLVVVFVRAWYGLPLSVGQ